MISLEIYNFFIPFRICVPENDLNMQSHLETEFREWKNFYFKMWL